jgi:hypothetical protein
MSLTLASISEHQSEFKIKQKDRELFDGQETDSHLIAPFLHNGEDFSKYFHPPLFHPFFHLFLLSFHPPRLSFCSPFSAFHIMSLFIYHSL